MSDVKLRREFLSVANFVLEQNPKNLDDIMIARLKWVEEEPLRPGLIQLEDKLWQRMIAKKVDVNCPKLIASFGPRTQTSDLLNTLSNLDETVIIKPTHLLAGLGVLILSPFGKTSFPRPSGPGCAMMKEWQEKTISSIQLRKYNTKEDKLCVVADLCIEMLKFKANITEAKPLREITPHIMVEELVEVGTEVRVLTIFGQVIGAATDNDKNYEICYKMEQAAKSLAAEARADVLRCDFFILKNKSFVLNECCSFLWPSDNFFAIETYNVAFKKLIENYSKICSPNLELVSVDQYVWKVVQNYASCGIGNPRYMTLTCNFYIIFGSEKIILIDSGCDVDVFSVLDRFEASYLNKEIVCVITHWHDDHVYGLKLLSGNENLITIYAHQEDAYMLRKQLPNICLKEVGNGDEIVLDTIKLEIHSTPGHTKGSISVTSNKGHIFTGDAFNVGQDLMFVSDSDEFIRYIMNVLNDKS